MFLQISSFHMLLAAPIFVRTLIKSRLVSSLHKVFLQVRTINDSRRTFFLVKVHVFPGPRQAAPIVNNNGIRNKTKNLTTNICTTCKPPSKPGSDPDGV